MRDTILKRLTDDALASENDEFEEETRQLIIGRYRVLFTIERKTFHVLHVRGAYVDQRLEGEDE